MGETPFTPILEELLEQIPGAHTAVLVDHDGEAVDYAGSSEPFDAKVAAAHLRIVLADVAEYGALGDPRWVVLNGARKSAIAMLLPDGYALCLLLRRRTAFEGRSFHGSRAVAICARSLALEAGWDVAAGALTTWHRVEVESDRRGRPRRIVVREARGEPASSALATSSVGPRSERDPRSVSDPRITSPTTKRVLNVEVMGSIVGLAARERGYRVRTAAGHEITVIRESRFRWYADVASPTGEAGATRPRDT